MQGCDMSHLPGPRTDWTPKGSSVGNSGEAAAWTAITTEWQNKVLVRFILKTHLKEPSGGLDWGGAKKEKEKRKYQGKKHLGCASRKAVCGVPWDCGS